MQKLKLLLLFFVTTLGAFQLTSCKDDDDASGSSIVGTWVNQDEYGSTTVTFYPDGRFVESWTESNGKTGYDSGSYTYDGKTLTMLYDDGYRDSYSGVVVSGNRLSFDGTVYVRV